MTNDATCKVERTAMMAVSDHEDEWKADVERLCCELPSGYVTRKVAATTCRHSFRRYQSSKSSAQIYLHMCMLLSLVVVLLHSSVERRQ